MSRKRLNQTSPRPLRSAGVALALVCVIEGSALAENAAAPSVEAIQAAEKAFMTGREAYKAGAFSEAAENFETADANAPNDQVLEYAIRSRDKAGNLDRAATLAQLAVERSPDNEKLRTLAAPLIERATVEMFAVTIECDEACALLDGTRIVHGVPATRRLVFLSPGQHTIRAGWSADRSDAKPVEGKAGEAHQLAFKAPPIPEAPPPDAARAADDGMADAGPKEQPSGLSPVFFWVGAGLTVATGGVAIWSSVDTLNNPGKEKVVEDCRLIANPEDCDTYQEGKDKELRTNILLAATGVLGAGTIVLGALFTNWSGEASARAPKTRETAGISPWLGVGDGAMLGARGRF